MFLFNSAGTFFAFIGGYVVCRNQSLKGTRHWIFAR